MEPDQTEQSPVIEFTPAPQAYTVKPLNPTVGQIVGFVLPDTNGCRNPGQVRPAIVVRVWTDTCVNLQVFTDGTNDYEHGNATVWATSPTYSVDPVPYTWHFLNGLQPAPGDVE